MTDEEYVLHSTNAERKRNGRGDFCKVRQGGKTIRFPSDYLTAKERKALNGAIISYNKNEPVEWARFKIWPEDIQREYIEGLKEKYEATDGMIAEMFGVHYTTVRNLTKRLGFKAAQVKKGPADKSEWYKFCYPKQTDKPAEEPEKAPEHEEKKLDVLTGGGEIKAPVNQNIAALLLALAGSGAKLTIEVTL